MTGYVYIRREFQSVVTERRVQLDFGNYAGRDLADNLQEKLRSGSTITDGQYYVTYSTSTSTLRILNCSPSPDFQLATRQARLSAGTHAGISFGQNPQDANDVIGLDTNATSGASFLQLQNMVQLVPFQYVYLTSGSFGALNQSQTAIGMTDVLRRVPIEQPWGNLI